MRMQINQMVVHLLRGVWYIAYIWTSRNIQADVPVPEMNAYAKVLEARYCQGLDLPEHIFCLKRIVKRF